MTRWPLCCTRCRLPSNHLPWNRKRNLAQTCAGSVREPHQAHDLLGGDKPVSLVYIPALADEHPETINDERAAPPLYHRRPTVPGGRLIEVKNPASPATKRDAEGIGWGR